MVPDVLGLRSVTKCYVESQPNYEAVGVPLTTFMEKEEAKQAIRRRILRKTAMIVLLRWIRSNASCVVRPLRLHQEIKPPNNKTLNKLVSHIGGEEHKSFFQ